MNPASSRRRRRRQHGAGDSPTRFANSWLEMRASACSSSRIRRSSRSTVLVTLGVSLEDAAAGPLARSGSFSGGRDIGVVFNLPGHAGPTVLPACGGVGTQYTPSAGWAQAIRYRHEALRDASYARSIAVALGGDASCATNGFWSALNIATTLKLPMLFYIEDNGFGI